MPLRVTTLEPWVQGECGVITFRLPVNSGMRTSYEAPHSCGLKYRLRGISR